MSRIVLIPGMWQSPLHYSSLIAALGRHNLIVDCQLNVSIYTPGATLSDDATAVRTLITAHLDTGRKVVVIAHSYGGAVAGIACSGLDVDLICISTALLPQSVSLWQAQGGASIPWVTMDDTWITAHDTRKQLYAECDQQDVAVFEELLRKQAVETLTSSSDVVPGRGTRRAYLVCLRDKALPPDAQKYLIASSGVEWEVKEIDADHSPFASKTEETASWIAETVQRWRKV